MRRFLQHLCYFPWRLRQLFPRPVLDRIEHEIAASERHHSGEICVAIEANLDLLQLVRGTTARARALEVFSDERLWDTEQNNGVLIYLLLAEQRVEIVADRGINARIGPQSWAQVCRDMGDAFHRGEFETGVCTGVRDIAAQLRAHFPATGAHSNELPNRPLVL